MSNKTNIQLMVTIDVGGTGTKFNIYDPFSNSFKIKTEEDREFQNKYSINPDFLLNKQENTLVSQYFVNSLVELIDIALNKASTSNNQNNNQNYTIENVAGIGICVPTQVNRDGKIDEIPAFKIRNLHLQEELKQKLQEKYQINTQNLKIRVIQDVLMHTLGMYKALKLADGTREIKSLMIVSAGTAAGIGIRLDDLNNDYKLIHGSEFQFPANILRGYGIKWSIENQPNTQQCPDLGWKTARKGIENTFMERVIEILESPTAIAITTAQSIDNLYEEIIRESNQGYHLARRIVVECLDVDNINNYSNWYEEEIEKTIENKFQTTVELFKNSSLIPKNLLENLNNEQIREKRLEARQDNQKLREIMFKKFPTLIERISSLEIDQAANGGDLFARNILEECATILGLSLSIIIPIIQPDYLIFAGGVSKSRIWLEVVKNTIRDNTPKWYEKSDPHKCFLTPDDIKPPFCEGATEVQLLGAVELINTKSCR